MDENMTTKTALPIIDFAPYLNGSAEDHKRIAYEIGKACTDVGFFYLRNSGVPQELISRVYDYTKRFFALPLEAKMRIHDVPKKDMVRRGYMALYEEAVCPKGDVKEIWDIYNEKADKSEYCPCGTHLTNLWPVELPGIKECLYDEYMTKMFELMEHLMEALAISLEIPVERLVPKEKKNPFAALRLLYYPRRHADDDADQLSCGVHTDETAVTAIYQEDSSGLEIKDALGNWRSVPVIKNTFVVNIGDTLMHLTNGKFKSLEHRILKPTDGARHSVAFFHGSFDAKSPVLPLTTDEEARFNPTHDHYELCYQNTDKYYARSYAQSERISQSS